MVKKMILSLLISCMLLGGCQSSGIHSQSADMGPLTYAQVTPESLLDVSEERVTVSLHDRSSVSDMKDWIERDLPSRAEVFCGNTSNCKAAQKILASFSVPYEEPQDASNGQYEPAIVLYYDRVLARDCQCGYELHHGHKVPVVGCATSANIIQMVTDRQQFTEPAMMGTTSSAHSAKAILSSMNR